VRHDIDLDRIPHGKAKQMSQAVEDRLCKEEKRLLALLGTLQNGRKTTLQVDQSHQIEPVTT
jgi:hypothetical protein